MKKTGKNHPNPIRVLIPTSKISASKKHLVFAYYVSGHGFGHATRVVEYFQTAIAPRASILEEEVEWLNSIKADIVVSDVVPVACRAAADAGIRSVCVTNFGWDFIYSEYVMASGCNYHSIIWQIAEDYSHCEFVICLPGYCPMPAFHDVVDVPLVRRLHKSRSELRKELGIADNMKLVIFNFGGQFSGARRLRDAIILGYQLQRASGRDICIPDWYALDENEHGLCTTLSNTEMREKNNLTTSCNKDFEILHGDLHGLSDTMSFLKSLEELDTVHDSGKHTEKYQRCDHLSAAGLFNWKMPIREACHVAVQRIHPSKQKLWEHAQAQKLMKGQESYPVLRIVSYRSESSNHGTTFDMELSDLMDGKEPISHEKANKYFTRDPSQKWAAFIAGTLLVLMTELGVRFANSISILVENHIVGAPCSVMDQMASACGEANKLLAMICQPAELIGLVNIPTHIRFWGIDSGIRHSISGTDYGSVRIGAFMGRKMIKSIASSLPFHSLSIDNSHEHVNGKISDNIGKDHGEILEVEASLDYLCNLSPCRYESVYAKRLPESLLGEKFLEKYVDHDDEVTVIDLKRCYGVRAAAQHPIYENFRVKAFKALLTSQSSDEQLSALGELMYQCHYSYNACGLGSHGTDKLVKLVQEMQHNKLSKSGKGTLFGAKITGGGSGGTVCVIGRNCLRSNEQILEIQQRYRSATGYLPFLFEGSSPGAGRFGYLKIRRRFIPA